MTSLGEILLKFGATGAEGEEPLRFKTAHINLLVGPNNAGKSLMLREISGINPRNRSWFSAHSDKDTYIVGDVHWDEATIRKIRQEVIDECLPANDPTWAEIKSRSWDQLLPGLEHAATELSAIRDRLCAAMFEHAGGILGELNTVASTLLLSDTRQSASLVVGGAVLLLQLTRIHGPVASDSLAVQEPDTRLGGLLTAQEADAVQRALVESWAHCEAALKPLGVDTRGLSLAELLDTNAFGRTLLFTLSQRPELRGLSIFNPKLKIPKPRAEDIENIRHLTALAAWVFNPEPLGRLAKKLEDAYAERTWANPEIRSDLARQVLYLDGIARLDVTGPAKLRGYDDDGGDQPPLLSLLRKPQLRRKLREVTASALGCHLIIDITTEGSKAIWRLSDTEPPDEIEGRWTEEAHRFIKDTGRLDERSDGIHAFVGMLAAIIADPNELVFIDEPEAFLHPPLVRKLARHLADLARELDMQFFIATHSADLLESFVASGAEMNIIRLTHDHERSTARQLNSRDLRRVTRDALLRSEATLSGLFHDGAVICEAAGDRVLYKEIHERLLAADEKAVESCVFLNAQNWETVERMVAPLRRMGVAAAAIVDADVIFKKGLKTWLDAAQMPKAIRDVWIKKRDSLRDLTAKRLSIDPSAFEVEDDPEAKPEAGTEMAVSKPSLSLKGKIIAGMKRDEKKIFNSLLTDLAEYGVFAVPVGELEDWLSPLGLQPLKDSTKKAKWLTGALDRLGEDPRNEDYVQPQAGDIWDFMRRVNAWILNPDREGTSSTTQIINEGSRAS